MPLLAQEVQVRALVLLAQFREQTRLAGTLLRPRELLAQRREIELREVFAGQIVVEIRRREDDRAVDELQGRRLLLRRL